MTRFTTVTFAVEPPIATVTLNRPEVHNAHSIRMRDELYEVFDACRRDDELRVVVIDGAGPSFCAGADLSEFGTALSPLEARRIRLVRDVWASLRSIPIPVVVGLHGYVVGSGLELALLATYRVAARSAQLWMPEARLGLVAAAGGTQLLPRAIGPMRARRLLYLGDRLAADDALAWQLVDEVVDDDLLGARTRDVAERISAIPRDRLCAIVRLLGLQRNLTPGGAARLEQLLGGLIP